MKTVKLSQLAVVTTGFPFKGDRYSNEGTRVVRGENVTEGALRWDTIKCWDSLFEQAEIYSLGGDDVVIGMDGSKVGKNIARIKEMDLPLLLAQRVACVRAKKNNSQGFLYYNLYNPRFIDYVFKTQTGSSVPHISKKQIEDFELPDIDPIIQQNIAKVLSDLDAKIELNNKINAELEAMAKLIYDYWFVQFDFPDENGKPYKSSGGKMVWNDELKREIPEGWEVDTLSTWIKNDKSGDWGKESEQGNYVERVFCLRGADLNGLNGKGEVKSPERFILEKNKHKILDPYDLVVEISGGSPTQSTGRMAYITPESLERFYAPIICSNFCKAVTLKNEKSLFNFAFEWNRAYDHGVLFGYEGKTSGIKNLLFETFVTNYSTPIPTVSLVEKFHDVMTPIEARKQKNLKENNKLAELRDWLLPMLMNGQVKVAERETTLQMVAEPKVSYDNSVNDKRKAIAACIILNSEFEERFGMVKFEKMLHLSEYHVLKSQNQQNYNKHAAGPLDSKFTYDFIAEAKSNKLISIEKMGNLQRIKVSDKSKLSSLIENHLEQEEQTKIKNLIRLFLGSNYEKPEIVSTLYAVWNNRIIKNELINDELIKKDFLAWDAGKIQYASRLDATLFWMREQGIVPDGWGEVIEKAKKK